MIIVSLIKEPIAWFILIVPFLTWLFAAYAFVLSFPEKTVNFFTIVMAVVMVLSLAL